MNIELTIIRRSLAICYAGAAFAFSYLLNATWPFHETVVFSRVIDNSIFWAVSIYVVSYCVIKVWNLIFLLFSGENVKVQIRDLRLMWKIIFPTIISGRIIFTVGTLIIILMLLFPPFHIQYDRVTINMGYSFILTPPSRGDIVASVDTAMLLAQWIGVIIIIFMLWVVRRLR